MISDAIKQAQTIHRAIIEQTYNGMCTICEHRKIRKENKTTGFEDAIILENQPCKLAFASITNTKGDITASSVIQSVKVFLAPEIKVIPGSKLIITQDGVTTDFKNSGMPAVYSTHQEVILELFRGWA